MLILSTSKKLSTFTLYRIFTFISYKIKIISFEIFSIQLLIKFFHKQKTKIIAFQILFFKQRKSDQ